jgi:hypothetical protein
MSDLEQRWDAARDELNKWEVFSPNWQSAARKLWAIEDDVNRLGPALLAVFMSRRMTRLAGVQ